MGYAIAIAPVLRASIELLWDSGPMFQSELLHAGVTFKNDRLRSPYRHWDTGTKPVTNGGYDMVWLTASLVLAAARSRLPCLSTFRAPSPFRVSSPITGLKRYIAVVVVNGLL